MRFGTRDVRSLYRAGSLRAVAEEISKYKLDLAGVQKVRWGGGGTEPAVKRVESVSDRISYIIVEGLWSDIIVMNVHAPTEDKINGIKNSFYEELEHVFDKFPKYPMKILLGYFNAKVGWENIFKPTAGNESLHEISNDNGVRVVNFVTGKTGSEQKSTHRLHMERVNLKKLNEVEGKEQYCIEISNRFAALENLDTEVDVNKAWETIRENIKMSAKESLGYYEPKKHKPWFDEGCSKLLDAKAGISGTKRYKIDCSNYLGISLLSTSYKIVSNIVLSRLSPYINEIIRDHQCRFRRNRSTTDQVFCILQILEKNGSTMRQYITYF
ncbi:hypothetical protein B7P43_G10579 [Cryptotermes secundus]|uniref:Uncharacterized protein n=1 Tax=Cryptotermes secundus TaxID=105785 RepID=A0A2J7Q0C2_9NEOP|nr:hypothetical protein B7P43_G10579 [Cryptotermes secundus]